MLNFQYVATNVQNHPDDQPLTGCQCVDECSQTSGCSCLPFGSNYDQNGLLISFKIETPVETRPTTITVHSSNVDAHYDQSIIECGSQCSCALAGKCNNRLVQNGLQTMVEVFDAGQKGYGLRTMVDLKPGQFLMEYAGEIIESKDEAKRRWNLMKADDANYLFFCRENLHNGEKIETFIDATDRSNLARFINHSCQPNLKVLPVRYNTVTPHLALFCLTTVQAGQELCYNYNDGKFEQENDDKEHKKRTIQNLSSKRCFCGSMICQLWLPSEKCCDND